MQAGCPRARRCWSHGLFLNAASDLEASVVRNDNLKFTQLSSDDIEAHLTALAERDDDLGKSGE